LDSCSLFYDIHIREEDEDEHVWVLEKLEELSDRAAQVEELIITFPPFNWFNTRALFNIFPNARVMRMYRNENPSRFKPCHFAEPIEIIHSESKVELLSDINHCELMSQMIYSNLGGRLKELDLEFFDTRERSIVVSQLKDLPVLKKLHLYSPNISIQDLEVMHRNVPSIQ
jgi:hypothetical protein